MDRSVCSFYQKIGACRHGEKCSRKHIRPSESKTVLLANIYQNPKVSTNENETMNDKQMIEAFDHFYSDVFKKLATVGEVERIVVCENENFHLSGNVYVRFTTAQAANDAVMLLNQEWYAGRPVYCELSPVSSFQEANCRAHDTNSCTRGDHCNFMHVIRPTDDLRVRLRQAQDKQIALTKIRLAMGDPSWGMQWEEPSSEKYKRESVPQATSSVPITSNNLETPGDIGGDPEDSKVEAVAKLFGKE
ncbi:hypothetical protein METBIDRAFT_45091 [Metschnikowia bicuspidata var. bicuspidata NRRL YB-4993]|uniref:RNA-binding domain-containing protein n=1 Tax=Metschnikowia bicuspidata var. bicuspidata NRRL YB-4993 TaxID=869754 RepID=A0A1A0H788_9ASCO|nr:hypothetical protein METBIDRAFT_45091 [Metschnikowia bicuspidata var. bicuspidata NRRL YB-4993]OBA19959.1 hypothetical protein METBIDRAFT_45091 [Metschnikowia bicuspidata var. bicuspidata NRRL YB-4993]